MRAWPAIIALSVACKPPPEEFVLGAPAPGLEELLGGITAYSLVLDIDELDASCTDDSWLVDAAVLGGQGVVPDQVAVVRWDISTGELAWVGDLVLDGSEDLDTTTSSTWSAGFSSEELSIPCTQPGGANLIAIPIQGTEVGQAGGAGGQGATSGCGYAAVNSSAEVDLTVFDSASPDAAYWRATAFIGTDGVDDGALTANADGSFSGEIPALGWLTSSSMPPVLGLWASEGDTPVATCAF